MVARAAAALSKNRWVSISTSWRRDGYYSVGRYYPPDSLIKGRNCGWQAESFSTQPWAKALFDEPKGSIVYSNDARTHQVVGGSGPNAVDRAGKRPTQGFPGSERFSRISSNS